MADFLERYLAGECEQVWDELLEMGDQVRAEPLYSETLEVARETMRRVRKNCETLILRLETIGYKFGYDWASPAHTAEVRSQPPRLGTPAADIQDRLVQLERAGAVSPISLRAFYEIVGALNFVGVRTIAMDKFEYGDDVFIEGDKEELADRVDIELDALYVAALDPQLTSETFRAWQRKEEAPYTLIVGYEAADKYFQSELGTFLIEVPGPQADAQLLSEGGYGMTFVEYLRYAISSGGLLSTSEAPILAEQTLEFLTQGLLPF
ncbi:MAG: hypothetical protein NVS2B12_22130 [Ktedonobacteraceae bacterium]